MKATGKGRQSQDEQVVVGGSSPRRRVRFGVKYIAVAVIAAVLITAGVVWYIRDQHSKRLAEDTYLYNSALDQALTLRSEGETDKALEVLNNYIDHGLDDRRKGMVMANIGAVYQTAKDNRKALAAYQKAESYYGHQEYTVALGSARAAYALGDKTAALTYYKQCLPLLEAQNDNHSRDDDIALLKDTIKRVESET